MFLPSINFNICSLQKPLSALNSPTVLFLSIAKASSKKNIQLLLLLLPLLFQQLATIRVSFTKQIMDDGCLYPVSLIVALLASLLFTISCNYTAVYI
jgi:hypothetical protein